MVLSWLQSCHMHSEAAREILNLTGFLNALLPKQYSASLLILAGMQAKEIVVYCCCH